MLPHVVLPLFQPLACSRATTLAILTKPAASATSTTSSSRPVNRIAEAMTAPKKSESAAVSAQNRQLNGVSRRLEAKLRGGERCRVLIISML